MLQALPGPWLMVFDDGVPAAALSWMPIRGRGHVLVTSLTGNWRGAGAVVEVSPMSVEDGVALLEARLRLPAAHGAGPALTALVQALECWPLAIVIAGGYLTSCRIDVSRLPAYTRTILARALDDPEAVPAGYPHTLVAAIRVSLERLRASAEARGLLGPTANALAALCWLAPHRIPVHLALACAFIPADEIPLPRGRALLDEADSPVREIIRELAGVSFIQHAEPLPARAELFPGSEDTVTMNAVLQSVLARELDMTAVAPAALPQAAAHTDVWLVQALRTGQAERSWLLAQHAAVLVGHLTTAGLAHNAAANLMGNLAAFHYGHGQYEQAHGLLEQELACLSGCENPDEGLAAQARIILAQLDQMHDLPNARDRIASHLAAVLPYLTKLADRNPDMAAVLATESLLILQTSTKTHTLTGSETAQAPGAAPAGRGWYDLLDAFTALVGALPATAESREMTGVFGISRLLSQGRPEQAELAAADALAAVTHTWTATAAELRRLLLEALVAQDKWEQAEAELERFLPFAGPRSLYRFSVQRLVHNAGTACALRFVLTGSEQAAHLLGRLLDDTGSDHLTTAANAPEHAQILLLHTVHALWQVFASEEAARVSSPAHLKFSNLLRQLTDKTFTDPHDPDSVWERIYDGLASRMTAMVTDVHHHQVQTTVDAGLGDNAELLQHNARFTELLNSGRVRGRLALSTDALLAATPIGTNADLLAKDRRFFPGPTPVVLLEPARMLGITLLETGEPFELQIHRICAHGFRRMLGAHTSVPAVADLHLHLDNSTLRLRGPQEVLLAEAPVAATREWHSAARARGRALVLYGFAFDLHLPPHQGALSSPHAFALRLAQAANAGLVAAALVPVTTSNSPPPRRKPHRARKASSKARQRR
ncbi:hypothetical protein [Actinacidiphila sp. ITFR-21]|uniref:hypothetical protein n=1 Tax=Actinacidiphila sp. ITFR-21 TaxID=3075199 RepID=UPI00288AF3EE|nr:hypothetical protein [Streptomyces sp. ITFR-21]WNI14075.1 hypothetical protein RLT57_00050 [Streptomyces sp. ITFR-21]